MFIDDPRPGRRPVETGTVDDNRRQRVAGYQDVTARDAGQADQQTDKIPAWLTKMVGGAASMSQPNRRLLRRRVSGRRRGASDAWVAHAQGRAAQGL